MQWTKSAKARLLPYPGDAWTVACDPSKSNKALAKTVGAVPDEPELEAEVARGVVARLDHRYDEKGNHARDTRGRDLVDLWCARGGVCFALEVLIAIARTRPAANTASQKAYEIRWDGQPWGRLREHLFTADADSFAKAKTIAAGARGQQAGQLRFALDYAFCVADWIDEDLDAAIHAGRGPLCIIAAIADPDAATAVVRRMLSPDYRRFELVEESFQHMPNIMSRLGDRGVTLVIEVARLAWNRATRKPWLDLVACYDSDEARAFIEEFA